MFKRLVYVLCFSFLLLIPYTTESSLPLTLYPCAIGLCIGGEVVSAVPCNEGMWINSQFMSLWGMRYYAHYYLLYPPQKAVGTAGGFITCTIGIYPIGGGLIVLPLTGTSLI